MELGNLLFGHSRGAHPIDPDGPAADRMSDLLGALGVDNYGRPDDRTVRRMGRVGYPWATNRGVDVTDPSGRTILLTRAYWWGDDADPQADLPNLEVPALDLTVRWYKYMWRDAYANRPLTLPLADRLADLLDEPITLMRPYVAPLRSAPLIWDGPACRAAEPVPSWVVDHGTVEGDPEDGYRATMTTRDGTFVATAYFDSEKEACDWCARRVSWRDADM